MVDSWLKQKNITNVTLLYRGSEDGFNPAILQSKCQNKGPTIAFYKDNLGYIFGGLIMKDIPTPRQSFYSKYIRFNRADCIDGEIVDPYCVDDSQAFTFSLHRGRKYPIKKGSS